MIVKGNTCSCVDASTSYAEQVYVWNEQKDRMAIVNKIRKVKKRQGTALEKEMKWLAITLTK